MKKTRTRRKPSSPAKRRHKHDLYQEAVQNPGFEVDFFQRIFRQYRGSAPKRLQEDFCGTALLCCEWVKRVKDGRAYGVDLDRATLDWGIEHNLSKLEKRDVERIELAEANVLDASRFRPDIVAALNFSWFVFKARSDLLAYFRRVRRTLSPRGVFVLDIYGGPEAQRPQEEPRDQDGFTYVWDQAKYNPITGDYVCHIHFDFPDGSRMRRAFSYEWRLWNLPETLDILRDAGFENPIVYWEGTAQNGSGNGVYRPSKSGDDSTAWVSYIVAPK